MHSSGATPTTERETRRGPLSASNLRDWNGYIRLPYACMRECGSAALTMGAILHHVNGKSNAMFAAVPTLARLAGVSERTAHRHLRTLERRGWIKRCHPSATRRTVTYSLTEHATSHLGSQWAARPKWLNPKLPWSVQFVFSVILSRLCLCESIEQNGCADERYFISLGEFERLTGLTRHRIVECLRLVNRWGFFERTPGDSTIASEFGLGLIFWEEGRGFFTG